MRTRERQAQADQIVELLNLAGFGGERSDFAQWFLTVQELANGHVFQSGDFGGRVSGGDTSDPTAGAALRGDELVELQGVLNAKFKQLLDLARFFDKTAAWARYGGDAVKLGREGAPEPTHNCQNPKCQDRVSGRGNDRLRAFSEGGPRLCFRCWRHQRKYGLVWPQRYVREKSA